MRSLPNSIISTLGCCSSFFKPYCTRHCISLQVFCAFITANFVTIAWFWADMTQKRMLTFEASHYQWACKQFYKLSHQELELNSITLAYNLESGNRLISDFWLYSQNVFDLMKHGFVATIYKLKFHSQIQKLVYQDWQICAPTKIQSSLPLISDASRIFLAFPRCWEKLCMDDAFLCIQLLHASLIASPCLGKIAPFQILSITWNIAFLTCSRVFKL